MRKSLWKERNIYVFLVILVFLYLVLRAILIQPAHDEIATFFYFVQSGKFLPYFSDWTTNNHFLNSFLTWISFNIAGSSPLALRLPNLLFFPVFAFFIWKISRYLHSPLLRWIWLISLISLHGLMEFFAMSRGYGISIAMIAGTIWFTMKTFENPDKRQVILAIFISMLSVMAILINLNTLIIIVFLILLRIISAGTKKAFLKAFSFIIPAGLFIVAVITYLFELKRRGKLDYGGESSFWESSVRDLLQMFFGKYSEIAEGLVMIYLALVVAGFIMVILNKSSIYKWHQLFFIPGFLMFYLLMGNVAGFLIEHQFFGVLYPAGRTSMQFALFFLGSVIFTADHFQGKSPTIALVLFPFILIPLHFLHSVNFHKISIENERIPMRFLNYVLSKASQRETLPTIQGYKGRELRWAYLQYRQKTFLPMIHCSTYPDTVAEYQIIHPEKHPSWQASYTLVDKDEISGLMLMERRPTPEYLLIKQEKMENQENLADEFVLISRDVYPERVFNHYFHQYEFQIQAQTCHPLIWLVVTVFDKENNELIYERVPLNWYNYPWRTNELPLKTGILICRVPPETDHFITYFWNPQKIPFTIKQLNFDLYQILLDDN